MVLNNLPQDVLLDICSFLGYNDVVSLSASCSYIRHCLNTDIVWKRLVGGDPVALSKLGPVADGGPLPPPCHQRQLCLRRARLVNNLRNQDFDKLSTTFDGSLFKVDSYPHSFITHSCTYENYLIGVECEDRVSLREVIKVLRFGDQTISAAFDLRPPTPVPMTCQVVGDKVVVRQDELFSVYQITPSERFPLLRSIDMRHQLYDCDLTLVDHLVFSEVECTKTVCVWDIHSGAMSGPLSSKEKDFDLTVIGHSSKQGAVLFLSPGSQRSQTAFILEYGIVLKAFTDFSVSVGRQIIDKPKVGLISDKYNVILIPQRGYRLSVCVYDRIRSVLVSEREFYRIKTDYLIDAGLLTFNDNLVLPSFSGLKITRLCDLEVMWKIPINNFRIIEVMLTCDVYWHFSIANALHLIVVSSFKGVSFWDCELRRKLFVLPPGCTDICFNDACTKLIFKMPDSDQLCVWTFGQASSDLELS